MPTPGTSPNMPTSQPEADPGDPAPVVSGDDRTAQHTVDLDRWTDLARQTLLGESVARGHLDVIFVDPEEMAELNEAHMGHEGPTDVLSFPMDSEDDVLDMVDDMPLHLGDIVICPDVAAQQAPEHCGTVDAELSLLIIHGILHILGHDHVEPEETAVMQDRERHHLSSIGIAHPVTA